MIVITFDIKHYEYLNLNSFTRRSKESTSCDVSRM